MSTSSSTPSIPLLPPPCPQPLEDPSVPNVPADATAPARLDKLGPMVVNSDGTLSRIANWENMTEAEKQRTIRVLAVRNRARLAKQRGDDSQVSSTLPSTTS